MRRRNVTGGIPQPVYFNAFRRMWLTHSAVVNNAYVRKWNMVKLLGNTYTKMSKLQEEHPSVDQNGAFLIVRGEAPARCIASLGSVRS